MLCYTTIDTLKQNEMGRQFQTQYRNVSSCLKIANQWQAIIILDNGSVPNMRQTLVPKSSATTKWVLNVRRY